MHLSANLKVSTLDIEIKHSRLTILHTIVLASELLCAYFAHFLAKSVYILCTCVNPILPEDKDHEDEPDDDD